MHSIRLRERFIPKEVMSRNKSPNYGWRVNVMEYNWVMVLHQSCYCLSSFQWMSEWSLEVKWDHVCVYSCQGVNFVMYLWVKTPIHGVVGVVAGHRVRPRGRVNCISLLLSPMSHPSLLLSVDASLIVSFICHVSNQRDE